jgi:hypothetical protein
MLSGMARPLRYEAAGALYHIMARGEGGKDVFEDDADRLSWMESAKVLEAFRLDQGARGQRAYARYLEERAKDQKGTLKDQSLQALRQAWYLDEDGFRDRILNALAKKTTKQSRRANLGGPAARSYDEAEARRMIKQTAASLGIDPSPSNLEGRGQLLDEKALLAWVVKTHTGVSNQWISDHLRTGHPSGVSKSVRRVTDDARLLRKAKRLAKDALLRDESE